MWNLFKNNVELRNRVEKWLTGVRMGEIGELAEKKVQTFSYE